jgi:hypothetical protein
MANFGELRDQIANEIDRDDLNSGIENSIQEAITEYETDRFVFNQKTDTSITMTVGGLTMALPTDHFATKSFKYTQSSNYTPKLKPQTADWIHDCDTNPSYSSRPEYYSIEEGAYLVYPRADTAYATSIRYFYKDTLPTADAHTNILITNAFNMIKFKAKSLLYYDVLLDPENGALFGKLAGGKDMVDGNGRLIGRFGDHKREFNSNTQPLMIGLS